MTLARTLALACLVACGGDKDDIEPIDTDTEDTEPPVPTGDTSPEPPGPDMGVTGVNNYTYDATWTLDAVPIRSEYDVLLSWSGLTTDAWGEVRDPTTYDQVLLFETSLSQAEFTQRLADDDLNGSAVISLWAADASGVVFTNMTDLAYEKTAFPPENYLFEQATKTWVVALADQVEDRLDIRAALVVVPTDLDLSTQAEVVNDSSTVVWSASIAGEPLQTAQGHDAYTVDWGDLDNDVHGKEYDRFQTTELFMGRWDTTPPDGTQVHDLKATASAWWTMDVEGRDDALLELARDEGGTNFAGFTAGATWLMGVRCLDCLGPAPLWLTEVEVQ